MSQVLSPPGEEEVMSCTQAGSPLLHVSLFVYDGFQCRSLESQIVRNCFVALATQLDVNDFEFTAVITFM